MEIKNSEIDNYLVIVKCMTYNQHSFIEDAMNGFCMQKTNFPYLCIIMDDCSTDREQEVIKQYVETKFGSITKSETEDYILNLCQHRTNKNCYFAVFYLKYNHWTAKKRKDQYFSKWQNNCKYIALCEGDDYWTDENKLQIQVNLLEKHPEYSASFHDVKIFNEKENKIVDNYIFRKVPEDLTLSELAKNFCIPTCSFIYRENSNLQTKLSKLGTMPFGDYSLELFVAENGLIRKIKKDMGVYSVGSGITTSTFNNPYLNFKRYLNDYMAMTKLWMILEDSEAKKNMQKHIEDDEKIIMNIYTNAQKLAEEYYKTIDVYNSFSFKLGKFITTPFRWIKKLIKTKNNEE